MQGKDRFGIINIEPSPQILQVWDFSGTLKRLSVLCRGIQGNNMASE